MVLTAHAFDAGTWGEWGAKVTVASQVRYARAVLSLQHGDRLKNQHRIRATDLNLELLELNRGYELEISQQPHASFTCVKGKLAPAFFPLQMA